MSEVIEALERKGLIERNQHPNHRRVLPAKLTATGVEGARGLRRGGRRDGGGDAPRARPGERDALYHGLVSSVRALHAGLPEGLIIR